jgi:tripartite-type tricarboxylate transporter receptor subunit TctC
MQELTSFKGRRALLLGGLALPWARAGAQADAGSAAAGYPGRLIRIVMPYSPGTGSDLLARMLAERLAPRVGQSVIVDSKPGASGQIGTTLAAGAAPDGHTLLVAPPTHVINSVLRKTPYDPLKDFEAVAQMARSALVLIVPPNDASPRWPRWWRSCAARATTPATPPPGWAPRCTCTRRSSSTSSA